MAQEPQSAATQTPIVRLLTLYSEARLHPGTGQTTGAVDLPIQRERHTQIPIIPASSVKGALREAAEKLWPKDQKNDDKVSVVDVLFGPSAEQGLYGGAIAFGEARLLAFPVRSLQQLFVWVTCPFIVGRFAREVSLLGGRVNPGVPQVDDGKCIIPEGSNLQPPLALEDLSFEGGHNQDWAHTAGWLIENLLPVSEQYQAVREKLGKHLVLISDNDFSYLVRNATEVTARIVLNDQTKTSKNLWYEETLPRDCLLYAWLRCENPRGGNGDGGIATPADVAAKLSELLEERSFVQIGGNETVGQGWCTLLLTDLPQAAKGASKND